MFNLREYYQKENHGYEESRDALRSRLVKTIEEGKSGVFKSSWFNEFIFKTASFLLHCHDLTFKIEEGILEKSDTESLFDLNHGLFSPVMQGNYEKSWCNPSYAVSVAGEEKGQIASFLATRARQGISSAFNYRLFRFSEIAESILNIANLFREGAPDYELLKKEAVTYDRFPKPERLMLNLRDNFSGDFAQYEDIVRKVASGNFNALFRYGIYITENEFKTALFCPPIPKRNWNVSVRPLFRHIFVVLKEMAKTIQKNPQSVSDTMRVRKGLSKSFLRISQRRA